MKNNNNYAYKKQYLLHTDFKLKCHCHLDAGAGQLSLSPIPIIKRGILIISTSPKYFSCRYR